MSTTLSNTSTVQVAVVEVDETTPTTIRQRDFHDEGMNTWIGDDAAIQVDMDVDLADVLPFVGWLARKGVEPSERGIVVTPHGDYVHPAAQGGNDLYSRWRLVTDTVAAA